MTIAARTTITTTAAASAVAGSTCNNKDNQNINNSHHVIFFLPQVKTEELERVIHELENALQRSAFELDRRLTQQQQEHERKIQLLMHQLMMAEGSSPSSLTNGDSISGAKSVLLQALFHGSSIFCSSPLCFVSLIRSTDNHLFDYSAAVLRVLCVPLPPAVRPYQKGDTGASATATILVCAVLSIFSRDGHLRVCVNVDWDIFIFVCLSSVLFSSLCPPLLVKTQLLSN